MIRAGIRHRLEGRARKRTEMKIISRKQKSSILKFFPPLFLFLSLLFLHPRRSSGGVRRRLKGHGRVAALLVLVPPAVLLFPRSSSLSAAGTCIQGRPVRRRQGGARPRGRPGHDSRSADRSISSRRADQQASTSQLAAPSSPSSWHRVFASTSATSVGDDHVAIFSSSTSRSRRRRRLLQSAAVINCGG